MDGKGDAAEDFRAVEDARARSLPIGARNYRSYVGPPDEYDVMGATQFCLLTALGLREWHSVLDVGCGSLRLGRLLIPYLEAGNFSGLEPNRWLVDDAIARHVGTELASLKSPQFFWHDDFDLVRCGDQFDFIIAQSILSHCSSDLVQRIFAQTQRVISDNGIFVFTAIDENSAFGGHVDGNIATGWVYPECTRFTYEGLMAMAAEYDLQLVPLPWFHARQSWYAAAKSATIDESQLRSWEPGVFQPRG